MFTNVSMPVAHKNIFVQHTSPSFGFAKLNALGRASADAFSYKKNEFLNSEMFEKQGFLRRSALHKTLTEPDASFPDICLEYGCTKNPKANADFIVNQVLNSKASSTLRSIDEDKRNSGLLELYKSNYDNPQLSLRNTKKLLELLKDGMSSEDYIKNVGILEAGTKK